MKFGAVYCLYDDTEYLIPSLFPISSYLDKVLFLISDVPWNGKSCDNSSTIQKVKELCSQNKNFELIQGHWTNEIDQRNFGLSKFFEWKIDIYFIIDSDEIYHPQHFLNIKNFIIQNSQYDAFHVEWNTYWKKSYYRIYPRESYKPVIAVNVNHFHFTIIRGGSTTVIRTESAVLKIPNKNYGKYNAVVIPPEVAICYHMSYARDDSYMKRKMEINSHAPEFIPNWYENIWEKWTPQMKNLHPVTSQQYSIALKEDFSIFPDQLKTFIKGETNRKCSIIILNWNSCNLLKRCLDFIGKNTLRPYDIIIIDNGSTKDDSVEYINSIKDVIAYKIILNKGNRGFSAGVNQGIMASDPDTDICLLNVDAEVQEGWLEEMYKTMITLPDAGMVGPLGNEVASGHQREGYVDRDCLTPNLYGYCLLIFRELIDKIGLFDEAYKMGGYEDNDMGIRAKLAGYELYISAKALVKHKAHQVYDLNGIDHYKMDAENREIYLNKFFGVLLEIGKVTNLYSNEEICRKLRIKL